MRRDLEAMRREALIAGAMAPTAAEVAHTETEVAHTDAPPGAPDGAHLKLEVDDQLRRDLDTMTRTGIREWAAVATALSIVAGTYRNAWAAGRVPDGVAPTITHCAVMPLKEGS